MNKTWFFSPLFSLIVFLHKCIDIEMRFDLRSTDIWTNSSVFFSVHLFEQMKRRRRISSAEYTSMWLENSRCCSYVARLRLLIKRMIITFWRFFSLRRWNNTEWAPLWMLTQAHHWCDLLFLIVRPFSTCWRQFPFLRRNLWLLFLTGIFQPWIMPYRFL